MSKVVICVAVYDTVDNGRSKYTQEVYKSLIKTITDGTIVVFINNGSCKETTEFLDFVSMDPVYVINLEDNIGTAEAINRGIKEYAEEGDFIVKMDNDCVVHKEGWDLDLKRCIESDPSIGVLGLKRKDLPNSPNHDQYPTELKFTSRKEGDVWNVIEVCNDIIGTCLMFNPELIKKVGYLYQPRLYGFDDVLMCLRSNLAGFTNAFYPSIEIDHIDTGETEYTDYKAKYAGLQWDEVNKAIEEYKEGIRSLYYNPFENE